MYRRVNKGRGINHVRGKGGGERVSSVRFGREGKGEKHIWLIIRERKGVRCQTSREGKRRQMLV